MGVECHGSEEISTKYKSTSTKLTGLQTVSKVHRSIERQLVSQVNPNGQLLDFMKCKDTIVLQFFFLMAIMT